MTLFQWVRLILLAGLLFPHCTATPWVKEVASVNGEKISLEEFQQYLKKEITTYDPELLERPDGWELVRKDLLNRLIHEKLMLQEVKKEKIQLSLKEKNGALKRLQSGYIAEEFEEELRKLGVSRSLWEKEQEKKLLLDRLGKKILSNLNPTEEQMKKEFQKNRNRYQEPERSHCRHIVTTSRQKAEKILELLKDGENFAALAESYSESPDREKGGDLGWVARGDLPPIMDDGCFRFGPGETSSVVSSAYGFHIFRVIEKRPPKTLSFEAARPRILQNWREENARLYLETWLKEKYSAAKIAIDEELVKKTRYPL